MSGRPSPAASSAARDVRTTPSAAAALLSPSRSRQGRSPAAAAAAKGKAPAPPTTATKPARQHAGDSGSNELIPETPASTAPARLDAAAAAFATPVVESPVRQIEPPTDNDLEDHGYRSSPAPRVPVQERDTPAYEAVMDEGDGSDPMVAQVEALVGAGNPADAMAKLVDVLSVDLHDANVQGPKIVSAAYHAIAARLRNAAQGEASPSAGKDAAATAAAAASRPSASGRLAAEIQALAPIVNDLVLFLLRDLKLATPDVVAQETLKLLGFMFYSPHVYSLLKAESISNLLKAVIDLARNTHDKTVCHLGVWVLHMQQLPATSFPNGVLQDIVNLLVFALRGPFDSITIPTEAITTITKLLVVVPTAMLSLASEWLLPTYACMTVSSEPLRKFALHFFTTHLTLLAAEAPNFHGFMHAFFQRHNSKLIFEITELINQNEREGTKLWSVAVVLLAHHMISNPAFANGMLKIAERCFNVKKASTKLHGYRAWSYLIYAFASVRSGMNDRRFRLLMIPIANSLANDRHPQLRHAAADAWLNLIYVVGVNMPTWDGAAFEIIVEPVLRRALEDPDAYIRDAGWAALEALVRTGPVNSSLTSTQRLGSIISVGAKPIEYLRTISFDPKWVRSQIEYLLEMLHAGDAALDDTEEWHKIEETGQFSLPRRVCTAFCAILLALQRTCEKEIHPTQESLSALLKVSDFVRDMAHDSGASAADKPVSAIRSDPTHRMDMLDFLMSAMHSYVPVRNLTSPRCRYSDLEEECRTRMHTSPARDMFAVDLQITPMVHMVLLWIESCPEPVIVAANRANFHWDRFSTLIKWASDRSTAPTNMYSLLYLLEIQPFQPSIHWLFGYWEELARAMVGYLRETKAQARADEFDQFGDQLNAMSMAMVIWPLTKLLEHRGTSVDFPLEAWTELWDAVSTTHRPSKRPNAVPTMVAEWILASVEPFLAMSQACSTATAGTASETDDPSSDHDDAGATASASGAPADPRFPPLLMHESVLFAVCSVLRTLLASYTVSPRPGPAVPPPADDPVLQAVHAVVIAQVARFMREVSRDASIQGPLPALIPVAATALRTLLDGFHAARPSAVPEMATPFLAVCSRNLRRLFAAAPALARTLTRDGQAQLDAVLGELWGSLLAVWRDDTDSGARDSDAVLVVAAPFLARAMRHPSMAVVEAAVAAWNARFAPALANAKADAVPAPLAEVIAQLATDPHVSIDVPRSLARRAAAAPQQQADTASTTQVSQDDVTALLEGGDSVPAGEAAEPVVVVSPAPPKASSSSSPAATRSSTKRRASVAAASSSAGSETDEDEARPRTRSAAAAATPGKGPRNVLGTKPATANGTTASSPATGRKPDAPPATSSAKKRRVLTPGRGGGGDTQYVPIEGPSSPTKDAADQPKTRRQLERLAEDGRSFIPPMYTAVDSQNAAAAAAAAREIEAAAAAADSHPPLAPATTERDNDEDGMEVDGGKPEAQAAPAAWRRPSEILPPIESLAARPVSDILELQRAMHAWLLGASEHLARRAPDDERSS
ncbi:Translation machinery-associated protein 22 [Blastocladiella emersonii ATCC 22665]|nr:Translation machinery-associated protein 22 [Blastocladiella emersonii ATCC 22665]